MIADASSSRLAVAPEVTWGLNPAAGAVALRTTGDDLVQDTKTEQSKEIRPDRNNPDLIRVDISAGGGIPFEFSAATFDVLMAGAMMSDWSTSVALTNKEIDITGAAGQTATLTDMAPSNAFLNVVVGQWIRLAGFNTAANNGYARVTAKASNNSVTVEGLTFVNVAGELDIAITASMLRIGTTKKSFTIERQWLDIANVYDLFLGMRVATISKKIQPGSIMTGKIGFLGKRQTPNVASAIGAVTASNTNDVLNAIDNIAMIREGSFLTDTAGLLLTDISFELNNNLRTQPAIGVLGASGIALGTAVATGSLTAYLQDRAMLIKYTDFTSSKLCFRVQDVAGNAYIYTFGRIKYGKGDDQVRGQNTDGLVSLNWTAIVDENAVAMQIDRFTA